MNQAYTEEKTLNIIMYNFIPETKILMKFFCRNLKNLPYS